MFISMQILVFHQEPSAPIAQREPICIFKKAHCVSLGVLWLDVKVGKKKISFLTLSSIYPKTKFRTVLMYFQVLFHFMIIFSLQTKN